HRILLSHGFSFVHCSPQIPRPGRRRFSPLVLSKTLGVADGSSQNGTFLRRWRLRAREGSDMGARPALAPKSVSSPGGFLSTSQAVAQPLPYLRRYARALPGSQPSGDAYVAATLEALVQDPKVLDAGLSTRIALYRLFTKIWNSVALNEKSSGGSPSQP